MPIPVELLQILQHAIGVDKFGQIHAGYTRNRFVTDPAGEDGLACRQLVALGLMVDRGCYGDLTGGDNLFMVSDAGRRVVREESPAPPRLTSSQNRYLNWLCSDCGLTFGEWLKTSCRCGWKF